MPYLAPEQLIPDKMGKPDWRNDVWQLDVVLHEVLMGRNPFTAETATEAEVIGRVLAQEPEPPSKLKARAEAYEHFYKLLMEEIKRFGGFRTLEADGLG